MIKKMINSKIFYYVLIVLISFLFIGNNSLWGDEICRVFDSISGDYSNMIKTAFGIAQPGYMLYMCFWTNLFNNYLSEFVIRASNLVFVVPCIYFAFKIIDKKKMNKYCVLLFFIHPMFTYYLNEATPYIALYALSLAYIYYVFFADNFDSKKNIILINLIYLLGVFVHFIFGFIIIIYFCKIAVNIIEKKGDIKNHLFILLLFCFLYVPLLLIYLINLQTGTATGFGLKNVLFILYAFLGMSGLGLPRNDLRAGNFYKFEVYQFVLLFIIMFIYIFLIYILRKYIRRIYKDNRLILLSIIVYFVCFFIVSFVIKFGIWERHCIVIFPLFILVLFYCFDKIFYINKRIAIFLLSIFYLMMIISSLNLRFNYTYYCDDHKGILEKMKNDLDNYDFLISNIDMDYYSLKENFNEKFIFVGSYNDEDIIKEFNDKNNSYLILFEKYTSKDLYNYFDHNEKYLVDDNYNSYKIVKHCN